MEKAKIHGLLRSELVAEVHVTFKHEVQDLATTLSELQEALDTHVVCQSRCLHPITDLIQAFGHVSWPDMVPMSVGTPTSVPLGSQTTHEMSVKHQQRQRFDSAEQPRQLSAQQTSQQQAQQGRKLQVTWFLSTPLTRASGINISATRHARGRVRQTW